MFVWICSVKGHAVAAIDFLLVRWRRKAEKGAGFRRRRGCERVAVLSGLRRRAWEQRPHIGAAAAGSERRSPEAAGVRWEGAPPNR